MSKTNCEVWSKDGQIKKGLVDWKDIRAVKEWARQERKEGAVGELKALQKDFKERLDDIAGYEKDFGIIRIPGKGVKYPN